jgi:hypothetical protein
MGCWVLGADMNLHESVLLELQRGDRNLGELKDALGCTYPELNSAIKALSEAKRVSYYFKPGMIPVLTYRIGVSWQS